MLKCEYAVTPYVSAAWLDTPEAMIVRKMRNNAIKKFPKNLNSMASSSLLQLDETYKAYHELGGNGMVTKMKQEIDELHLKQKGE